MSIVTFLEAKLPLQKVISTTGTRSYQNAKLFTSHELEYPATNDGLKDKFEAVKAAALAGQCQYRGQFDAPLVEESRAGRTLKDAPACSIMFDLDGMTLPGMPIHASGNDVIRLEAAAEHFIQELPPQFHHVSYIAHASSSFGLKGDQVSMHIEFELTTPVAPRLLKLWLTNLNLTNKWFKDRVRLTNSKLALSYPIDITMGENSRIVYIAPPRFEGVTDPFKATDDRYTFVPKDEPTVSISAELSRVTPDGMDSIKSKLKNKLRKNEGLGPHKAKYTNLTAQGEQLRVLNNPDAMTMSLVRINEKMGTAYWNINGGDSNAYYCYFHSPNIIHNFKGEDLFEFSKADPETYSKFMDTYGQQIGKANPVLPHVFVDYSTSQPYKLVYDLDREAFLRPPAPIRDNQVEGFFSEYGRTPPEVIPTFDFIFDPHSPHVLDVPNQRVNRYDMPQMLRNLVPIMPQLQNVKMGEGHKMAQVAPNCYKLIHHMLGACDQTFEYFINWLAYCVQERKMSKICWVITGTQGTGKGEFYDRILLPMFGEHHTSKAFIEAIEDQFNGSMETNLMAVVDEFNINTARSPDKLIQKLKNLVSEQRGRIRGMRQEGRDNVKMYVNWLIYSNDMDAMKIPEDDRRFCVSPPQKIKLGDAFPEMNNKTHLLIPEEVPRLASFLMHYSVDHSAAATVLQNYARDQMINAGKTWVDSFFCAFKTGDIDFFAEALHEDFNAGTHTDLMNAKQSHDLVQSWLADALKGQASYVSVNDLRLIYNSRAERPMVSDKFVAMLRKYAMPEKKRLSVGGTRQRVWTISWILNSTTAEDFAQFVQSDEVTGINSKKEVPAKSPATFAQKNPPEAAKE